MPGFDITDKLCIVLEGAAVVGALALAGYAGWQLHTAHVQEALLAAQNTQLQHDNATLQANQKTLQTSLDGQNMAVLQLADERDSAQSAADAAMKQIQSAQSRRSSALRKLQAEKAQSCTEAMPMVRQALGAMQ